MWHFSEEGCLCVLSIPPFRQTRQLIPCDETGRLTTAILMIFLLLENHLSCSPFPQKSLVRPNSCSTIFFTTPKSRARGFSSSCRFVHLLNAASTSDVVGRPLARVWGVKLPEAAVDEVGDWSPTTSCETSTPTPSLSWSELGDSGEDSSIKSGPFALKPLLDPVFLGCWSLLLGRNGIDVVSFVVLQWDPELRCAVSLLLRQGDVGRDSLLNTFLNSFHLNFDMIYSNSCEKGGPFKSLIRDDTPVSKKDLRKDA